MDDRTSNATLKGKTLQTTLMHAPELGSVEIIKDALITIDHDGTISSVLKPGDPYYETALATDNLVKTAKRQYLLPGFVDLHIHAPQWPQLGKALDVPLEVWLQKHTFPLEARYEDSVFAERVYGDLVSSLLAHGTTSAVYFATIHQDATRTLADICLNLGQRAFIGKVAMDNEDQCPDFYRDADAAAALDGTRAFVDYVLSMPGNDARLIRPVITPRFIPSCTDAVLSGLGQMAADYGCHVQTHCSESDWEHAYVLERTGKTDTEALDNFGLLGRHTVLAHSNFLSDDDMDLIHSRGSGVAHCPLSNVYFSNAVFPLRRALEKSVRVGLGTDISGGPSASMLDSCRHAISASRNLEEGVDPSQSGDQRGTPDSRISFREAFHLATAGGADVLDIPVGRFAKGCKLDAILVDADNQAAPISIDETMDSQDDILQKIINGATRANISTTWVAGRAVHQQA
ncbi:MAG: guanine deaminase [Alphaproteobacteria bacterium]